MASPVAEWFPVNPTQWLLEVNRRVTNPEHRGDVLWVALTCLADGALPDDDGEIAYACSLTVERVRELRPSLLSLQKDHTGQVLPLLVEKAFEERRLFSKRKSDAARAKWEKARNGNGLIDVTVLEDMQNDATHSNAMQSNASHDNAMQHRANTNKQTNKQTITTSSESTAHANGSLPDDSAETPDWGPCEIALAQAKRWLAPGEKEVAWVRLEMGKLRALVAEFGDEYAVTPERLARLPDYFAFFGRASWRVNWVATNWADFVRWLGGADTLQRIAEANGKPAKPKRPDAGTSQPPPELVNAYLTNEVELDALRGKAETRLDAMPDHERNQLLESVWQEVKAKLKAAKDWSDETREETVRAGAITRILETMGENNA
jgi:hypothetical protein